MTKRERLAIARAFQECKKYLWLGPGTVCPTGGSSFICHALGAWGEKSGTDPAREVIEARLGDCRTLESWLHEQGITSKKLTDEKVQAHRHAWVDLLIEEFSQ